MNTISNRLPTISHRQRIVLLAITTAALATTATFILTGLTGAPTRASLISQNAVKPLLAPALTSAPRLMLEGVFLTENEQLAMISRRAYRQVSHFNGIHLASIATDPAMLHSKNPLIALRHALKQ